MRSNLKRNGAEERNIISWNVVTGMMTKDERTTFETTTTGEERTTTEIITIATTPQIMTKEETTEGTHNDECTRIRTEGTFRNMVELQEHIKPLEEPLETTDNDPTWKVLQ